MKALLLLCFSLIYPPLNSLAQVQSEIKTHQKLNKNLEVDATFSGGVINGKSAYDINGEIGHKMKLKEDSPFALTPYIGASANKGLLSKNFSGELGTHMIVEDAQGKIRYLDLSIGGKVSKIILDESVVEKYGTINPTSPNSPLNQTSCEIGLTADPLGALDKDLANVVTFSSGLEFFQTSRRPTGEGAGKQQMVKYDAETQTVEKVSFTPYNQQELFGGDFRMSRNKFNLGVEFNSEKWLKSRNFIPYLKLNYTFEQINIIPATNIPRLVQDETKMQILEPGTLKPIESKSSGVYLTIGVKIK